MMLPKNFAINEGNNDINSARLNTDSSIATTTGATLRDLTSRNKSVASLISNYNKSHDRSTYINDSYQTSTSRKKNLISLQSARDSNRNIYQVEDDLAELKKNEKEVLKLNYWEKDKTIGNDKKDVVIKNINETEIESLNWVNELRTSLAKINLTNASPQLIDFYNKDDNEQNTIYMQNINLAKKKFNFEIFDDKTNELKINERKHISPSF